MVPAAEAQATCLVLGMRAENWVEHVRDLRAVATSGYRDQ